MANQSLFQHAAGGTPAQLQLALRSLTDKLNQALVRQQEQTSTGLADAQAQLDALLAQLDLAQASITDILADLESIEAGGLSAQIAWEISLITAVSTLLGSVSNAVLNTINRSDEAADSVIRSLLKGRKNEIAIRVEQAARLTDKEAFVSQLSTFSAQLGLALGQITEEIQARSDGDNSLASVDQQITTALNGNVAQVQILAQSIDGIEQKFAISLNENGQVVGLIQLDGSPAGTNFTVVANKFQIAQPDETGGAPVTAFSVQNVNGTNKLALEGDMLANGTIAARHFVSTSVSALFATLGTIVAGKMQRADGTMIVDLDNKRLKISS